MKILSLIGDCCSKFWFRRAGYSGLHAGFSEFPDWSLRAPTRSLRILLADILFIEVDWVDNMSYASHLSLHSPVHPTVKHIRAFVVLLIYMPKLWTCQVKIEIQSSWHTLRGSSYMLDVYHFMLIKWATCGLSSITKKGGDWKISRPLSGFWCLITKHTYV